ncbi:hypothetical protein N7463_004174 [Penicillium fimorum]|uniref:Uncharacterized protein n=1 Tax=Penicillium fimorum TaxID=1882269 RepID=A0A9X0CA61_9EURO|nr:hypothetical protein N7463_004174 [Penicillium fimorum]
MAFRGLRQPDLNFIQVYLSKWVTIAGALYGGQACGWAHLEHLDPAQSTPESRVTESVNPDIRVL